ncbi:MAG: hypothetical protein M1823_004686 [Watsoniomyces obsoletus]|nr:MAG: hypothetical protein M1823_004686 [Watsoniomyces obsoletus]
MDQPSSASLPITSTFPKSPDHFEDDPRISYSKLDEKWILETDDGAEFEYDQALKRWIPSMGDDEALLEQQREAYAVAGVDETEPALDPSKRKKRSGDDDEHDGNGHGQGNKKKTKLGQKDPPTRKNTAVYVTNLPPDTTVDEVRQIFSRCGVIAEEIDQGKPRIKLYMDEKGKFKGDALVVYFRAESVDLAVQMLDDTDFRLGEAGTSGKMKVQAADFSYKSQKEVPTKTNVREKKKVLKKTQKMNNKLADWDDDDPAAMHEQSARWDKVVIMKHLFTLKELEEDPAAMLDIKEDIREECVKLGEVTNVVLFDREEDGVASVRFSTPEAARACVRLMDGRLFSGVQVEAYIANGNEKFKKTSEKKTAVLDEDDEEEETKEENQRLDQFGNWLEKGGQ